MRFIFLSCMMLLVTAFAHSAELSKPVVLNQEPLGKHAPWGVALDGDGGVWLAYYGADNNLYVRRPDGSAAGLSTGDRPRAMSGLAIEPVSSGLSLMWRDKLPEKTLYYLPQIGADGQISEPRVVADADTEPLTRLHLAKQDEVTYFLWYGEKGDPATGQKYNMCFRYSEDDGKTFSEIYQVLPGYYPAWIVDGGPTIPVFTWAEIDGRLVMAMRSFDREDKTFGPIVEITEAPHISPIFHAFESADRWFLMWLGHYGELRSELLLEGAYSDDRGQTWKRFAFESLRGLDLSRLDTATDDEGHVLIALSGAWRQRDPGAKNDIYLIRSTDNGSTWSEPRLMRSEDARFVEAKYPSIIFGAEKGSVMMVWEDWRDIRAGVYANYSSDHGATWWDKAVPVETPGRVNVGLDFKVTEALLSDGKRYYLAAKRYTDDTLRDTELVLYSFTPEDLKRRAAAEDAVSMNATESRLRERVTAYWQALKDEDYETTYAMHDPFFRARKGRNSYLAQMGVIKYHDYEFVDMARKGNLARVALKVDASVPEFKVRGESMNRPSQEYPVIETWVFVDNDWYREYYIESTETRYTRY